MCREGTRKLQACVWGWEASGAAPWSPAKVGRTSPHDAACSPVPKQHAGDDGAQDVPLHALPGVGEESR